MTSGYNNSIKEILDAKFKKELLNKSNISNLIKNFELKTKIATLALKAELKTVQDKIVKL